MSETKIKMGAIVAMSRTGVIGRNGTLPWHYSEDLKRFKKITSGKIIIMGRITWESIGSKPLPNRDNRVVTQKSLKGVNTFPNLELAIANCDSDVWFIGGAQLYLSALQYCDFIDITWVPDKISGPDLVYFPEINDKDIWIKGPEKPFSEDSKLINQLFTRR